jgi:hypothetical protein
MEASELIDKQFAELDDWRGPRCANLRALIHAADPDLTEEWKWNNGIYSHDGMVCAIAAFRDHVKVNFFQGASLEDPRGLFNAGLDAKKTRAIDLFERDTLDEGAFQDLVRSAVQANVSKK